MNSNNNNSNREKFYTYSAAWDDKAQFRLYLSKNGDDSGETFMDPKYIPKIKKIDPKVVRMPLTLNKHGAEANSPSDDDNGDSKFDEFTHDDTDVPGLTSHHGIHGNSADSITISDLVIKDFEVAGIALNGFNGVTIENVEVGPCYQEVPVLGLYTQARVMLPRMRAVAEETVMCDSFFLCCFLRCIFWNFLTISDLFFFVCLLLFVRIVIVVVGLFVLFLF